MADTGKSTSDPKAVATNAQPKVHATENVKLPRNISGQSKKGMGNKGMFK
jgi:hypothetical protein